MTIEDVKQKVKEIKKAIKDKNYAVDYDVPNFVEEYTAVDGSHYLVVSDMDGPKSSNYCGQCFVDIAGFSFTEHLDFFEPTVECDYLDEVEDLEDGYEYREIITDLIKSIPEYPGGMDDMDGQVETYKKMTGSTVDEYYWYEDDDIPMNIEDFVPIEEVCDLIKEYGGVKYYTREIELDEKGREIELSAVRVGEKPNRYGQYPTVVLVVKDGELLNIRKGNEWFNSTENWLEEEKGE